MNWNLFSLVLASATGWGVLALGYLPVSVLRRHSKQPLVFVGAWALVSAAAPPVVFHWYLIFALIGLIAWTKLDRPGGKVCLAIAAALGLSLGIVFPLEAPLVSGNVILIGPGSALIENPLALASLYLGGAVTGIGYVLCVVAVRHSEMEWRLDPYGRWLLIFAMAWTALFAVRLLHWSSLTPTGNFAWFWAPSALGVVLIVLTFFALMALRRRTFRAAASFAGLATIVAFGTSLLVQLLLR
jgi:hypothetical protein